MKTPKCIVGRKEVHICYVIIDGPKQTAVERVAKGEGNEHEIVYSHRLPPEEWTVGDYSPERLYELLGKL